MAGKSGKRIPGKRPATSSRTSPKVGGAFGKEGIDQVVSGSQTNRDKVTIRREDKG